eukprot:TRINITY_DN279_c0_g1_i3.p1 TRINITY_DN279_c0_g1~~TRINITY_DN279_c0_g1_i3.p1  ORF type:complete len:181 (+),score=30.98 TRINITY_DN279_c0_g1_i3:455-997(+)
MLEGKAVSLSEADKYRARGGDYVPCHPVVASDQQAAALVATFESTNIPAGVTFSEYVLARHGDAVTRSLTYRAKHRTNAQHLEQLKVILSGDILQGESDVISDEMLEDARRQGPAGRISTADGLMLFATATGIKLAEARELGLGGAGRDSLAEQRYRHPSSSNGSITTSARRRWRDWEPI